MKRLLPLALVLLAAPAMVRAQESYAAPATAAQQVTVSGMVDASNGKTCLRLNLAIGCAQGTACTTVVPPAAGGASCTPAQARASKVRIFPNTFAGREEYFQFQLALVKFDEQVLELVAWNQSFQKRTWDAGNTTVRNTMCTAAGLAAGCLLYP